MFPYTQQEARVRCENSTRDALVNVRLQLRTSIYYLVMAAIVLIATEISAYVCYIVMRHDYFAPQPSRKEFVENLEKQYTAENFDRELGWLTHKEDRDGYGARISPDSPIAAPPCLSLYGDSFVYGDEVSHAAAWGNQLAKILGCKVFNFGVSGYGTDQAYLRFLGNTVDPSSVVMLGMQSENIVRNVNQNRAFLYAPVVGPLKPLYWLDGDRQLRLDPMPQLEASSYETYIKDPRRLFPHEYFIPDSSPYAEQRVGFPYATGVVRGLLGYKRTYIGLLYYLGNVPPWYADFFDATHPSGALDVTQSIIGHYVDTAEGRGKTPIIMFMPTSRDIKSYLSNGKWVYETLYQRCRLSGYHCFDAGSAMLEELGAEHVITVGVCEYFCFHPLTLHGHYNEKGHRILAHVFLNYLKRYLPEAGQR